MRELTGRRFPPEFKNSGTEATMTHKAMAVSLTAVVLLASVSAFGAGGEKAKAKGMITARTGETLIVKSAEGSTTVVLTDDTTTKDDRGLFGLEKQHMSNV